ncbi:hypothetical protein GIB67_012818 [Kingdonia uniflora]|uniref:Uncharacterized protein n=1 Tax=Kingdonia uniflora TaxID=39325 RepID=A0A7J7NFC2_9MAGN|nr:hypothetical protein GIB67_012818 [Kingdonia uniflora]
MPSQFGSSAPSPPFGLSGYSTLSSTGTALSGASVPADCLVQVRSSDRVLQQQDIQQPHQQREDVALVFQQQ